MRTNKRKRRQQRQRQKQMRMRKRNETKRKEANLLPTAEFPKMSISFLRHQMFGKLMRIAVTKWISSLSIVSFLETASRHSVYFVEAFK